MKLIALHSIYDGKTEIKPGTPFDRPKKEAEALIASGAAETNARPLKAVPAPDPDNPGPDPGIEEGSEDPQTAEPTDNPEPGTKRDPLTGLPTN
ncbi:hypothetical protein KAI46_06520 [bacterium]|nr:hypothetical protein [bacterium]